MFITLLLPGNGDQPVSAAHFSTATAVATTTAVSIIPDGLPVITAENVTRLKPIARLGRGAVGQAYWSPNNQILAVTSSIGVWLYTANQLYSPPRLLSASLRCDLGAFSPDGTLFAVSTTDGMVRIWNVQAGTSQLTFNTNDGIKDDPDCYSPAGIAWSPDGSTLALGSSQSKYEGATVQEVSLWSVQNGNRIATLKFPGGAATIAFSKDGKWLAASNGGDSGFAIGVWDTKTYVLRGMWSDYGRSPIMLAFGIDDVTLFYSTTHLLRWTINGSNPPQPVDGISLSTNVTFNPDLSLFAFGDEKGLIHIWNTKKANQQKAFAAQTGALEAVAWSPDGKHLASIGNDDSVRIWDIQTQQMVAVLEGYAKQAVNVRFSPDGQTLAVSTNTGQDRLSNHIVLRNLHTGSIIADFPNQAADRLGLSHLQFSPDGVLLAASTQVWNVKTGRKDDSLNSAMVAFSPDGKLLAVIDPYYPGCFIVQIWDAKTLDLRRATSMPGYECPYDLMFSPDSGYLVTNRGFVWDMMTGQNISLSSENGNVCSYCALTISADSQSIAIGWGTSLDRWNIKTKTALPSIADGLEASGVRFSSDGSVLMISGEGTPNGAIEAWDVTHRNLLTKLSTEANMVYAIDLSPNGTLLAAAMDDGTVVFWGVQ